VEKNCPSPPHKFKTAPLLRFLTSFILISLERRHDETQHSP
jgi:hypothetical protein